MTLSDLQYLAQFLVVPEYPYYLSCLSFLVSSGISSLFVINSRNPVDALLLLVLVFLNSAGFLLLLGADFLALIFVIIYVGAIAVLFLFVVMMLSIKKDDKSFSFSHYFPFFILYSFIFLSEFYLFLSFYSDRGDSTPSDWFAYIDHLSNIEVIGQALFTSYSICVLLSGFLLLIAMIGSIILSLEPKSLKNPFGETTRHIGRGYASSLR